MFQTKNSQPIELGVWRGIVTNIAFLLPTLPYSLSLCLFPHHSQHRHSITPASSQEPVKSAV